LPDIEVCKVKGVYPVHKLGDRIALKGARILLEETDTLCVHVLSSLLHHVVAFDEDADPVKLSLTWPEDRGHAIYSMC